MKSKNYDMFFENKKGKRHLVCKLKNLAKGKDFDCVSRTFAPKMACPEDPVCGSGHCHIIPYWADKLGKKDIVAFQASARSGVLYGKLTEEDLIISGYAATFSRGEIKDENGNWE